MGTTAPVRIDLDQLLCDFLAGTPEARNALPRHTERYLRKIARRLAWDLPEDLLGEVVNQTFERLLRLSPDAFDARRSRAGTFLGLVVRDALREVRTSYTRPGAPTRVRKPRAIKGGHAAALKNRPLTTQASIEPQPDHEIIDVVDHVNTVSRMEMEIDLRRTLCRAPEQVAEGLVRIHAYGEAVGDVASAFGISRFALNRQIERYVRDLRAAA